MRICRFGLLATLFVTGCTVSRPLKEEVPPVSFMAMVGEETASFIKVRCTLSYPPGAAKGDVWSKKVLSIVARGKTDHSVPFTIENPSQGMVGQTYRESTSRFVLSPIAVRRSSKSTTCFAQAVLSVYRGSLKNATRLIIRYDGSINFTPDNKFEKYGGNIDSTSDSKFEMEIQL